MQPWKPFIQRVAAGRIYRWSGAYDDAADQCHVLDHHYGILYWGITCIRAVFTLGLWRYFKERTWLGRFLRFCKRWTLKGLDLFSNTDWEGKSTRIIGKAVIANFIILALISCLWFWGIGALVIYSLVLFFLFKKYWGKWKKNNQLLLKGINAMAEGNLDVEFDEDLGI